MSYQIDWGCVDDVRKRREIEYVFTDAVKRSRRPLAVSVASKINGVDVKLFAKGPGYPVPVASMIQTSVNKDERRLALIAPIPEVKFQPVGVIVV
jgi:hypothetical protein